MRAWKLLAVLLICSSVSAIAAAATTTRFTVTDLGNYQGYYLRPLGMNDRGDVVGIYTVNGREFPFLYHDNQVQSLRSAFTGGAWAYSVNNSRDVVGLLYAGLGTSAYLYHNGTKQILAMPSGDNAQAVDINSLGMVTGSYTYSMDGISHGFIYRGTQSVDIGTLGGSTVATAINENGTVTGFSYVGNEQHLIRYNTTIVDLGAMNGYVCDINSNSQIVGDNNGTAFLYDGTRMINLGTIAGPDSHAQAINDQGWIVGYSTVSVPSTYGQHAFLYQDGEMYDLNTLLATGQDLDLYNAVGVNQSGQIVVEGAGFHTYLLTPVPEPAAFVLLFLALPILVWWRGKAS
jgi:probable HAF family extracellular repeat protein